MPRPPVSVWLNVAPRDRDALRISRSSGSPADLPARPRVYVGVRFRDPGEINENTRDNGTGPTGPTTRELLSRGTMLRRLNRGWAAWTTGAATVSHYSSRASCVGVHPPTGVTTRQRTRKPRGHEETGALTTVHGGGLPVLAGTLRLHRSERPHPSRLPVASTRPLPHYRVGGKILVRRSEFDTWMSRFRVDDMIQVDAIVADVLTGL